MTSLTNEGESRLETVARQNNVTTDAARTLLDALVRGGGTQAQFSHPELGGMGQWTRGGMIMLGDMFNSGLKARVDRLCSDLSAFVHDPAVFQASSGGTGASREGWWPARYSRPSTSGSQNNSRYAYFPSERRLAVETNGEIRIYDTGDHRIGGVSQQQGGGQDLVFQSQMGQIRLYDLARIETDETAPAQPRPSSEDIAPSPDGPSMPSQTVTPDAALQKQAEDDVFAKIERLHELFRKGILTEDDFTKKKTELLARI